MQLSFDGIPLQDMSYSDFEEILEYMNVKVVIIVKTIYIFYPHQVIIGFTSAYIPEFVALSCVSLFPGKERKYSGRAEAHFGTNYDRNNRGKHGSYR